MAKNNNGNQSQNKKGDQDMQNNASTNAAQNRGGGAPTGAGKNEAKDARGSR